jgi:integrase/recombinase XerD
MTENDNRAFAKFEVDASVDELKEDVINNYLIDEKVPKFIIKRKQKGFVDKTRTPLWQLEEFFMNEQEARRNTWHTKRTYKQVFEIFYEFVAYTYCESVEDIDKMYESAPPTELNPLRYYGKMFPIAILENDDLQKDFGEYLANVRCVSEKSIETYFRNLRVIMYFAMENKFIIPFSVTIKNVETKIKDVYTDAEIKKLLRKPRTEDFEPVRNWVIVNYLLGTGNRLGTVINLKVKDIDFDDNFININTQKSKKVMRIGLTKELRKVLRQYIDDYRCNEDGEPLDDEYLFCTKYGGKLTEGMFKKMIKTYNLSRGVNKTSTHLFRHTYAKMWITSGGDLISLQKALGHSSLRMVERYSNLYETDVREKMQQHSALSLQKRVGGSTIKKRKPEEEVPVITKRKR